MANELKTTLITYEEGMVESEVNQPKSLDETKQNIHNVLFNVTTKVPHVTESLSPVQVQVDLEQQKTAKLKTIEQVNTHAEYLPKFYIQEYKRSARIAIAWLFITLLCAGLESWALARIMMTPVNNWVTLTLIPGITICIAMLVVYVNNWINFRNEARNVDFSQGKIPTISVMKLYKRLKTAHINVNWFCFLAYIVGGLSILITYLAGWGYATSYFMSHGNPGGLPTFGVLDPNFIAYQGTCGASLLISVIVSATVMIVAFFMHVILLVTNYTRAAKIDSFYSVQIVSDDELTKLKKKKNKRDMIIFLAVVMILILIGLIIYRTVKSKKVNNNTVTINNGPSATIK